METSNKCGAKSPIGTEGSLLVGSNRQPLDNQSDALSTPPRRGHSDRMYFQKLYLAFEDSVIVGMLTPYYVGGDHE